MYNFNLKTFCIFIEIEFEIEFQIEISPLLQLINNSIKNICY